MCRSLLEPLQPYLVGHLSRSVQPPVHDTIDAISLRSWINNPWSAGLDADLYKATNILNTFIAAARLEPEKGVPTAVLQGAKGLAVLSVLKLGAGWSCTVGTGKQALSCSVGVYSMLCAVQCVLQADKQCDSINGLSDKGSSGRLVCCRFCTV